MNNILAIGTYLLKHPENYITIKVSGIPSANKLIKTI